jgi:hypothetical protein
MFFTQKCFEQFWVSRFAGFKVQRSKKLERAQRAGGENKQAVLCDLRASNERQRVGGAKL